eukprot:Amastigsp_a341085_133.p3 type:complete len:139 gc:universal Amastigsp_a341085_133:333-749(+)
MICRCSCSSPRTFWPICSDSSAMRCALVMRFELSSSLRFPSRMRWRWSISRLLTGAAAASVCMSSAREAAVTLLASSRRTSFLRRITSDWNVRSRGVNRALTAGCWVLMSSSICRSTWSMASRSFSSLRMVALRSSPC